MSVACLRSEIIFYLCRVFSCKPVNQCIESRFHAIAKRLVLPSVLATPQGQPSIEMISQIFSCMSELYLASSGTVLLFSVWRTEGQAERTHCFLITFSIYSLQVHCKICFHLKCQEKSSLMPPANRTDCQHLCRPNLFAFPDCLSFQGYFTLLYSVQS
jgi:hypothetical protein